MNFRIRKTLITRLRIPFINKSLIRNCSVRRALFYVPGDDERKLFKAKSFKVDCIVMDCEDGVARSQKETARMTIRKFLDEETLTKSNPEWSVRINPVTEQKLCEADIDVILSAKHLPSSICLPKVYHVDHLQWVRFAEKIWNTLIKRPDDDRGPIKLLIYIESAMAVVNLSNICKKAEDLSTMAPIVPVALVFGSDDLRASLGAVRSITGMELLYARQKIVLFAKAFGLQAIDMVNINYQELKQLEVECRDGLQMGYTGKQVIHPNQITITQEAFVPSQSKIKWAKKVIKSFDEHQHKGKGAFTLENAMIDMPTVRQAQNIINTAKLAGKITDVNNSSET